MTQSEASQSVRFLAGCNHGPSVSLQREVRERHCSVVVMMVFKRKCNLLVQDEVPGKTVAFSLSARSTWVKLGSALCVCEWGSQCVWQLVGIVEPQWNVSPCLMWSSQVHTMAPGCMRWVFWRCVSVNRNALAQCLLHNFKFPFTWPKAEYTMLQAGYLTFKSVNL